MTHSLLLSLILLLSPLCYAEDWYFPNSRMISDAEYKEKIINDHSTYKLVKFFTPHCQFCRYLKDVIDTLKAQKQWSFEIYDFNCAWYPAVCTEIKAYSFPFTAVYNPQGDIESTLVGFYPYPVVKQTFDKIQESSLKFKSPKATQTSNLGQEEHEKVMEQVPPIKIEAAVEAEKKEENHQQVYQQGVISNEKEVKHEQKPEDPHYNVAPQHLTGASQHIFYAVCFFLGVVYYSHFSKPKKHTQSKHQGKINPQTVKDTIDQKHICDEVIS